MRRLVLLAVLALATLTIAAPAAAGNSWSRSYSPAGVEWTR